MIFHAFQREDDDAIFTVVYNVSGDAWVAGYPVQWDGGTSVNGVRCTKPTTGQLGLFRGVVAEAIANSGYGKVQVGGYCAAAYVIDATVTLTTGQLLLPTAGQYYFTRSTVAATGAEGFAYLVQEFAANSGTLAAATKKVLLRAL